MTIFSPGFKLWHGDHRGDLHYMKFYTPKGYSAGKVRDSLPSSLRRWEAHMAKQGYDMNERTAMLMGPYTEPTRLNEAGQLEVAIDLDYWVVGCRFRLKQALVLSADEAERWLKSADQQAQGKPMGYGDVLTQFGSKPPEEQEAIAVDMAGLGEKAKKEKRHLRKTKEGRKV